MIYDPVINVYMWNLDGCNELVTKNEDDSYLILIEDSLSPQGKRDAFNHAMRHIVMEDFAKYGSVQDIEMEAHR